MAVVTTLPDWGTSTMSPGKTHVNPVSSWGYSHTRLRFVGLRCAENIAHLTRPTSNLLYFMTGITGNRTRRGEARVQVQQTPQLNLLRGGWIVRRRRRCFGERLPVSRTLTNYLHAPAPPNHPAPGHHCITPVWPVDLPSPRPVPAVYRPHRG